MSEEEKLTKKQKIEDNRRLRAMSQNLTMFSLTASNSPTLVSENELSQTSFKYQKCFDEDKNTQNIFLYDNINEKFDFKPVETIPQPINNEISIDYKALLNENDRILLTQVDNNYARAVELNVSSAADYAIPSLRNLNHFTNIVNELTHISSARTITFLKLTPEFRVSDFTLFSVTINSIYILVFT